MSLAFAQVDDHRLAGVGEPAHRHGLGLAQLRPRALGRLGLLRHEVGELDPVEREVADAPLVAPALDHQGEEVAILVGPAGVRLALVPDHPPDAVADRRLEDAVVDVARACIAAQEARGILRPGRRLLPFRLRLLGGGLPLGQLRDVGRLGLGGVPLDLLPALDQGLVLLVGGQQVAADPGLAGRPAPGVVDEPDRHVERLVEELPEVVAHRGERPGRLGGAGLPFALEVGLRLLRADLRDGDEPDGRVSGRGNLQVRVVRHPRPPTACSTAPSRARPRRRARPRT